MARCYVASFDGLTFYKAWRVKTFAEILAFLTLIYDDFQMLRIEPKAGF